jgi:hypothetical protein
MVSTPAEARPQDAVPATAEQLTKDLLFMKKQYTTLFNTVQGLTSQVMRLDRDVRALSLRRHAH